MSMSSRCRVNDSGFDGVMSVWMLMLKDISRRGAGVAELKAMNGLVFSASPVPLRGIFLFQSKTN